MCFTYIIKRTFVENMDMICRFYSFVYYIFPLPALLCSVDIKGWLRSICTFIYFFTYFYFMGQPWPSG